MRVEGSPLRTGRAEVSTVVCFAFADMATVSPMEPDIAGDHVQLVPGIDHDLEGLVVHLLQGAPTVFVIVRSPALAPERLEAVLSTYSKQRESNHRLCVVEYDPADGQALLAEIEAAVQDMRERVEGSAELSHRVPRRQLEPSVPEPTAVSDDSASIEIPLDFADSAPIELGAEPMGVEPSDDRSGPLDITATNPGVSESSTFPNLGLSIEQVRRGQAERVHRTQQRRIRVLAVLTVSVLAAAAVVWLKPSTALDEATNPRVALVAPKPIEAAPIPTEPPPTPQEDPAPPKRTVEPPPLPVASVGHEAADEARRVAAALDAGEIHALDALLIRTASRAGQPISEARRRCAKLDVVGVDGWRLPTLEELRTLRRARLLPQGEYWSGSWVDKESLFTLDSDITRPGERMRDERVGVLCVRGR